MQIEGVVTKIFPKQVISDKFSKIDFVIQTTGRFPKEVLLTASGKSLQYAETLGEGQEVEVEFDLSTRATKDGKYFGNSANCWKIHVLEGGGKSSDSNYSQAAEDNQDLPF